MARGNESPGNAQAQQGAEAESSPKFLMRYLLVHPRIRAQAQSRPTTSVEGLRPREAGPLTLTHTQGLHSLPDPDHPELHMTTSDRQKPDADARPPGRPRAHLRDPLARGRKGPHGPRRHFLGAIAPLAGIRLPAWRHSALSRFQEPFGFTRLPPSFTAEPLTPAAENPQPFPERPRI